MSEVKVFKERWFKVLDASGIPFSRIKDGMVLRFIRDLPELGQYLLYQPISGVVGIDYDHVEEVHGQDDCSPLVEK